MLAKKVVVVGYAGHTMAQKKETKAGLFIVFSCFVVAMW